MTPRRSVGCTDLSLNFLWCLAFQYGMSAVHDQFAETLKLMAFPIDNAALEIFNGCNTGLLIDSLICSCKDSCGNFDSRLYVFDFLLIKIPFLLQFLLLVNSSAQ
jgi:hypothetical protein